MHSRGVWPSVLNLKWGSQTIPFLRWVWKGPKLTLHLGDQELSTTPKLACENTCDEANAPKLPAHQYLEDGNVWS